MAVIKRRHNYIASYVRDDVDDDFNPIQVFDAPRDMICSIGPISASHEVDEFGEDIDNLCRAILDYDTWINNIAVNDRVWLYGSAPVDGEVNGDSANFYVYAVQPQNFKICVFFKRRD